MGWKKGVVGVVALEGCPNPDDGLLVLLSIPLEVWYEDPIPPGSWRKGDGALGCPNVESEEP